MSSLKTVEKEAFEELLGMSGGYVLEFTNQKFASFFNETVKVDIYADKYAVYGDSKARRLRAFWEIESDALVGKVLAELIDLWKFKTQQPTDQQKQLADKCRLIVGRLLGKKPPEEQTEEQFLRRDLRGVSLKQVPIESSLIPILEGRYEEAVQCLNANSPLATIFLCGSILEGLLLGVALKNMREFNQASSSPKDDQGKVKVFQQWTLAQFIDVGCELGHLKLDVKKFGHALRDFRNYIHPYQQMSSQFNPDKHTAEICLQVLRAAIASLNGER